MSGFYTHESIIVDLEFCGFSRFLLEFYPFIFYFLICCVDQRYCSWLISGLLDNNLGVQVQE